MVFKILIIVLVALTLALSAYLYLYPKQLIFGLPMVSHIVVNTIISPEALKLVEEGAQNIGIGVLSQQKNAHGITDKN